MSNNNEHSTAANPDYEPQNGILTGPRRILEFPHLQGLKTHPDLEAAKRLTYPGETQNPFEEFEALFDICFFNHSERLKPEDKHDQDYLVESLEAAFMETRALLNASLVKAFLDNPEFLPEMQLDEKTQHLLSIYQEAILNTAQDLLVYDQVYQKINKHMVISSSDFPVRSKIDTIPYASEARQVTDFQAEVAASLQEVTLDREDEIPTKISQLPAELIARYPVANRDSLIPPPISKTPTLIYRPSIVSEEVEDIAYLLKDYQDFTKQTLLAEFNAGFPLPESDDRSVLRFLYSTKFAVAKQLRRHFRSNNSEVHERLKQVSEIELMNYLQRIIESIAEKFLPDVLSLAKTKFMEVLSSTKTRYQFNAIERFTEEEFMSFAETYLGSITSEIKNYVVNTTSGENWAVIYFLNESGDSAGKYSIGIENWKTQLRYLFRQIYIKKEPLEPLDHEKSLEDVEQYLDEHFAAMTEPKRDPRTITQPLELRHVTPQESVEKYLQKLLFPENYTPPSHQLLPADLPDFDDELPTGQYLIDSELSRTPTLPSVGMIEDLQQSDLTSIPAPDLAEPAIEISGGNYPSYAEEDEVDVNAETKVFPAVEQQKYAAEDGQIAVSMRKDFDSAPEDLLETTKPLNLEAAIQQELDVRVSAEIDTDMRITFPEPFVKAPPLVNNRPFFQLGPDLQPVQNTIPPVAPQTKSNPPAAPTPKPSFWKKTAWAVGAAVGIGLSALGIYKAKSVIEQGPESPDKSAEVAAKPTQPAHLNKPLTKSPTATKPVEKPRTSTVASAPKATPTPVSNSSEPKTTPKHTERKPVSIPQAKPSNPALSPQAPVAPAPMHKATEKVVNSKPTRAQEIMNSKVKLGANRSLGQEMTIPFFEGATPEQIQAMKKVIKRFNDASGLYAKRVLSLTTQERISQMSSNEYIKNLARRYPKLVANQYIAMKNTQISAEEDKQLQEFNEFITEANKQGVTNIENPGNQELDLAKFKIVQELAAIRFPGTSQSPATPGDAAPNTTGENITPESDESGAEKQKFGFNLPQESTPTPDAPTTVKREAPLTGSLNSFEARRNLFFSLGKLVVPPTQEGEYASAKLLLQNLLTRECDTDQAQQYLEQVVRKLPLTAFVEYDALENGQVIATLSPAAHQHLLSELERANQLG